MNVINQVVCDSHFVVRKLNFDDSDNCELDYTTIIASYLLSLQYNPEPFQAL